MTDESIERIRERILEEQYDLHEAGVSYDIPRPAFNELMRDARAITLAYDALVKKLRSHPPTIHVPAPIPSPREWIKWDQFNPKARLVLRQQDEESEMCVLTDEIATSANRDTAQTEKELSSISLTSEQMMWLWGAAGELLLGNDTVEVKLAKVILENDDRADLIQQLRADLRTASSHIDQHVRDLTVALDAVDKVARESAKLVLRHAMERMRELRSDIDVAAMRPTNSAP
jgi:hypothetical protein